MVQYSNSATNSQPTLTGYTFEIDLQITVNNVTDGSELAAVIDAAVAAGGDYVQISSISVSRGPLLSYFRVKTSVQDTVQPGHQDIPPPPPPPPHTHTSGHACTCLTQNPALLRACLAPVVLSLAQLGSPCLAAVFRRDGVLPIPFPWQCSTTCRLLLPPR
jgi:hypothetical protein